MQFSIETPCSQTWENMAPVDGENTKRYCAECSKCVVDLRGLNNKQIRKLYIQSNRQLCGILPAAPLAAPATTHRFGWFFSVLIATTVGLFRGEMRAQNKVEKKEAINDSIVITPLQTDINSKEVMFNKEMEVLAPVYSEPKVKVRIGAICAQKASPRKWKGWLRVYRNHTRATY